jgi:hypothetical protein
MVRVAFNDAEFVSSHCRAPRGRGSWAFALKRNADCTDVWFAPGSLTFAEAKRAAVAHVRAAAVAFYGPAVKGSVTLVVCS